MTDTPSSSEYLKALKKIVVTELQKRMLEAHYRAPGRTVTAPQIAQLLGYSHYAIANKRYGNLGKKIGNELRWIPPNDPELGVAHLATFEKTDNHWHWIMRPQLASALEKLGWVNPSTSPIPEEISKSQVFVEGAVQNICVNSYERNPHARKQCVAYHGYKCAACGILLSAVYGEIGNEYIHVHHIHPLSEIKDEYEVDPIRDLLPVCPNCHAMIHRRNPPYSIKEIAERIRNGLP